MKQLLLSLCTAIFFSAISSAQVSTIQVSVSDTIEVPANHIAVMISFKDTTYTSDEPVDFTTSRESVIRLLDENKVKWKKAAEDMGFLGVLGQMGRDGGGGEMNNALSADFNSAAQLDKLLPVIKSIRYVETMETGNSLDKDQIDMTRLYAKLLKKAQAKAEVLAKLSGKKVGTVYQIGSAFDAFNPSNAMESMMGGGGAYGQMMKSMLGNMFSEKRADHKVTVTEQLTVTYLLQ